MHSFKDDHETVNNPEPSEEESLARMWTIVGIILCIAIVIYLSIVARRAVDDELEEDEVDSEQEERRAFLSEDDLESAQLAMVERGSSPMLPTRQAYIRMTSGSS